MSNLEILSLVITFVCLLSFSAVFTILFKHFYTSSIEKVDDGKEDINLLDQAVVDEKNKKNRKKKAWSIVGKVFSWVLLISVVGGFGFSLYARVSGNTMPYGDTGIIVIASGSMEKKNSANQYLVDNDLNNQISTYDIIQIKKYGDESQVKLYDVVAYKNESKVTIVHRIISVSQDPLTGKSRYITRGDANSVSDDGSQYAGYLSFDDIVGYYTGSKVAFLGSFVIFLQSNAGIITIVALIYCLFMFSHYRGKYDKAVALRTESLLSAIGVDLDSYDNGQMNVKFDETIYYKGYQYRFADGSFQSKESQDEKGQWKSEGNDLIVVKDNGEVSVKKTGKEVLDETKDDKKGADAIVKDKNEGNEHKVQEKETANHGKDNKAD